ncbi:MAG: ABC transporter permease [Thermofilaceae archaeon]
MERAHGITRSQIHVFLLIPSLAFLTLVLIGSVTVTLAISFNEVISKFVQIVTSRYFVSAYLTTIKIGFVVIAFTALLSYPLAIYGRFKSPKLKSFFDAIVFTPLMVNPLIRAFGWMIILGKEGLLNTLLLSLNIVSTPLRILYTDVAVELGLTELFLPFMYLSISSALENIPEEYVMAARSLGASSFRAFVDIVFPLSITGFITGSAIVMTGCAAAFVTPSILGGLRVKTLSILLREYVDVVPDWVAATIIALMILATVLAIILGLNLVKRVIAKW